MSSIGIIAALHHEIASLLDDMDAGVVTTRIGQRDYHAGTLLGCPCVVVLARIGKVAAAATTVTLIREFDVSAIVFTGLAGAVSRTVNIGDVVVARSLLQHDMDASPLFPKYQVPLLDRSHFEANAPLADLLATSASNYLLQGFVGDISVAARSRFGFGDPVVHSGLIISGDRFVSDAHYANALQASLPDALCVEMEGAAVAQICHEYDVPYAVLRTISDRADGSASVDFSLFLNEVASFYSAGILRHFLAAWQVQAIAVIARH